MCSSRRWYDRADLGLRKNIVDVQFLGAMNHKSGSFSVNPRLQRHFVTLGCQTPGDDDLSTVRPSLEEECRRRGLMPSCPTGYDHCCSA